MTKKPREISWGRAASIAIGALLDMEARRKNRVEREAAASMDQDSVSWDLHEAVVLELEAVRRQLAEVTDALRAATENIGILEGIRDRLRQRVHEAVDECQRRYAKTESDLAKLRHFMRESLRLHGEEMKRLGKSPYHNISGYGQATFAMFLRELEALNLVVAAAESWRDRLSGQVLADYELPLRDAVDLHRAWRKEGL